MNKLMSFNVFTDYVCFIHILFCYRLFTSTVPSQAKQEPGLAQPHQLPILDLSLPKKPDPSVLEQFVNPGALVPESSVLKALTKPDSGNIVTKDHLTGKIIR